jgi:predicted nucleotidyltransferase
MIHIETEKQIAHDFYRDALKLLNEDGLQYLIGGAFALRNYTGIYRDTKDLDLFCKAGDYPKILKLFALNGLKTEVTDSRWLAKAFRDDYFIDLIFNTVNNLCPVESSWFEHAHNGELYGVPVKYVAPEELVWCKIYIQDRYHYDGADVNHIILKKSKEMDWPRVINRLDQHWHLLLAQFLNFQFVYPSERETIPKWLFEELLDRSRSQYELPLPLEKVCRGPYLDHTMYNTDIIEWDYKIITVKRL